jgi:hypothetical protein
MSLGSTSGTSARQVLEIGQPRDLWFERAWGFMLFESIIPQPHLRSSLNFSSFNE